MENVIEVKQLSKSYGDLIAVKNLSLSVKAGSVFGLLGANGAGKSTTVECILGTKKPDSGSVSILDSSPIHDRKTLFEKVGVQFQEAHYQEYIQVGELCEVTSSLYKNPADYMDLLTKFGIADKIKSPVKELSGGQKQKQPRGQFFRFDNRTLNAKCYCSIIMAVALFFSFQLPILN